MGRRALNGIAPENADRADLDVYRSPAGGIAAFDHVYLRVYTGRMAENIADTLKRRIESSGESLYQIAKGSEVAYPVLYRFVSGERDLTLRNAAKLCKYLRLRLTSTKRR